MNWSSAAEFFAMGGYGFYVWCSFGMVAVVMAAELMSLRARRRALQQVSPDDMPARAEFATRPAHEA